MIYIRIQLMIFIMIVFINRNVRDSILLVMVTHLQSRSEHNFLQPAVARFRLHKLQHNIVLLC